MNASAEKLTFNERAEVAKRFRLAGILFLSLALVGWIGWFSPFDDLIDRSGTPLGGDFVMLFVAGQAVATNDSSTLYDDQQNQIRSNALFPKMNPSHSWPYRYPPTVAAVMAPVAQLPFIVAWGAFLILQITLLVVALSGLCRLSSLIQRQPHWLWAVAGAPVVIETVVGGQSSLLALVCVIATAGFLKRQKYAMAGVAMAIAMYKPNVLALFVLGCVIVHPRTLRGLVPTVATGVLVAVTYCGWDSLQQYTLLTLELASTKWGLETPSAKVHGLAPYFQSLLPAHGKFVCLLLGIICSAVIALQWRTRRIEDLFALSLLLVVNSLFNPYVPIYDLVLLIPALVFACESLVVCKAHDQPSPTYSITPKVLSARDFQWLAGVLVMGPHVSQSVAPTLGYQLFPVVVTAVVLTVLGSQFVPRFAPLFKLRCDEAEHVLKAASTSCGSQRTSDGCHP